MADSSPRPLTARAIEQLQRSRCLLLTTFKVDGTPVATPVWPFTVNGRLMASTQNSAWKLKRMSRNPRVTVSTCTQRGKPTGPTYEAHARILGPAEAGAAMRAKRRRWWIQPLLERARPSTTQVPFEILS